MIPDKSLVTSIFVPSLKQNGDDNPPFQLGVSCLAELQESYAMGENFYSNYYSAMSGKGYIEVLPTYVLCVPGGGWYYLWVSEYCQWSEKDRRLLWV